MARSNTVTNIKSKNKISKYFSFQGLIFLLAFGVIAYAFKESVAEVLIMPYIIFNCVCAFFLILPSRYNKERNHLESIFILFRKDEAVYRPYIAEGGDDEDEQVSTKEDFA